MSAASLKPDFSGRARPSDHIVHGIVASGRNLVENFGNGASHVVERDFPVGARATIALMNRATAEPATTTTTGWAAELAHTAAADLVLLGGGVSALPEIARRVGLMNFQDAASIALPTMTLTASGSSFVKQGQPIPVRMMLLDGGTIAKKKIATAFALTRELFIGSNAELSIRKALPAIFNTTADAVFFDALPGDDVRPAGVLNGVVATAPTAGGGEAALITDLANLATAVAAVAGKDILIVADPVSAAKIAMRLSTMPYPVIPSSALAANTVIAIALPAVVIGIDNPVYSVSEEAIIHSDNAPTAISTVGAPNATAAPVRSLWQTLCIGIKYTADMSWGLRTTGAVAVIQNVTW